MSSRDLILVAVGRRPLTEDIGLEAIAGVELDRGYVKVDGCMRTGAEHLYAIGDIVPGFALAHVAAHESVVAVETIAGHDPDAGGHEPHATGHVLPPADRQRGHDRGGGARGRPRGQDRLVPVPRAGQGHHRGRGRRLRQARGRCGDAACCWAPTSSGPHAGDLLAEPTLARLVEGTAAEIAMSVHAHPTLTEVLAEAALAVDGAAIHV